VACNCTGACRITGRCGSGIAGVPASYALKEVAVAAIQRFGVADLDFISMSEVRRSAAKDVSTDERPKVVMNHGRPIAVLVPYEWFVQTMVLLKAGDAVDPVNRVTTD